jgi:hypothetical protein
MMSSTVIRGLSGLVLGLGVLAGCDSQMNDRTGDSRSGGSRVADRPGVPATASRPGTIGTTPTPEATISPTKVDDAAIETQIKAKLQAHAAAGLGNVDVESDGGVVRLTGVVQRPELKQRAAELARNVDGVRDIVNNIEVRAA